MIPCLYEPFKHWAETGSVIILSDPHFNDANCKLMDPNWIHPIKQVNLINKAAMKCDTFICLGDVGDPSYINRIRAKQKILIMGNHDVRSKIKDYFDEIYDGPLFIADKILLSHEPISLPFCLNIHGHGHNQTEDYTEGCKHLNLAANVCGYTPVNLGKLIKQGILSDIEGIHRQTINRATEKKEKKMKSADEFTEDFMKNLVNGKYDGKLEEHMREASDVEMEKLTSFIQSISKETGVNFYDEIKKEHD